MNWIPIDHNNPPEGRVLFYFHQSMDGEGHYIQYHYYKGLTELGYQRVTHWCQPIFPGEEDVT